MFIGTWYKAGNVMPEKGVSVLVSDGSLVGIGEWYGYAEPAHVPHWMNDTCEIEEVKYWAHLPQPPIGDVDG